MTPEQKLWQWIRYKLPGHVERIENSVGSGRPDVNMCCGCLEANVELKVVTNDHVVLRPSQNAWINKRLAQGGLVSVIGMDKQGEIYVWNNLNILFDITVTSSGIFIPTVSCRDHTHKLNIEMFKLSTNGLTICLKS